MTNRCAGPDSEELPATEEFFLPGSGASLGLTPSDLEAGRTATWDDNTLTIDDLEAPGDLLHTSVTLTYRMNTLAHVAMILFEALAFRPGLHGFA